MHATGDMDLLQEYAIRKSEPAFAEVVSRHINLVYSAALRQVGNPHQAQEITQAVFIVLARKAGSLRQGTVLSGWLFRAVRMTASNFLRTEMRRARREQEAYMQSTVNSADAENDWKQVAPLLDAAIADLSEKDRNAIVLRYVEGKDLKEVGAAMGSSEDAAKKRVSRAVDKLRGYFSKRGVALSGAALAAAISANAMQAAPTGLAAAVAANAVNTTVMAASTLALAKGTIKLMAWTKINIAAGVAAAALMAYQWHQNLQQGQQIASLQTELRDAQDQAGQQRATIEKLQQQKLAMVNEKVAAEKASAKLVAHQRAALTAKMNTAANSNSPGSALGKMFDDPAMKDFIKQQQLNMIKTQYAPLIKQLNLSPDAADKFIQILSDDAVKKMDVGMAALKGDLDPAAVSQDRTDEMNALAGQLQSLLGPDGYAQYEDFTKDLPNKMMLGLIKAQMTDNPLTDDQSARLLALMKSSPPQPASTDITRFSSADAQQQYLQQQDANNQRILQQAADFLSPEQIAALGSFQSNMLSAQKLGMAMVGKLTNK